MNDPPKGRSPTGKAVFRFEAKAEPITVRYIKVPVQRDQASQGRLRAQAPDGREIIIDLPRGEMVHDGDFFGPSEKGVYYQMKIVAEDTLKVDLEGEARTVENMLRLGYSLGRHHLEVLVERDSVYLPLKFSMDRLERILKQTGLSVKTELVEKVIDPSAPGYFDGENEQ